LQQPHGVEAFELCGQLLLERRIDAAVRQKPIARRRWSEVDLVNAGAVARLGLQLERRLEEVDVESPRVPWRLVGLSQAATMEA
jgi:hypothetical protein